MNCTNNTKLKWQMEWNSNRFKNIQRILNKCRTHWFPLDFVPFFFLSVIMFCYILFNQILRKFDYKQRCPPFVLFLYYKRKKVICGLIYWWIVKNCMSALRCIRITINPKIVRWRVRIVCDTRKAFVLSSLQNKII